MAPPLTNNGSTSAVHDPQAKTDQAKAEKLLAQAESTLQAIDDAHIIVHGDHEQRAMPRFSSSEVDKGDYLGEGGYGLVHQVNKISLQADFDDPENSDELQKARLFLERHCQRQGKARYAMKTCKAGLRAHEKARGMIDLAVEAKYLATVSHPNIIKLRGMAQGPLVDDKFFILLDRLETTLDKKMQEWGELRRQVLQKGQGWWRKRSKTQKTQQALNDLMVIRLTVAYDLAKAFYYLHSHRVVYRDIKGTNIGFDVRGDVKVFDFGFCKSLCPTKKAGDDQYGYHLTPRVGSFPHMAPEVFKKQCYDTKCDIFSFAVLLWEILSCELAWSQYSAEEFVDRVFIREERSLPISTEWPPLTRVVIPEAWHPAPTKRPDMERIAKMIHSDLEDLTNEDEVLHRTKHMKDRTNHSIELELECHEPDPDL